MTHYDEDQLLAFELGTLQDEKTTVEMTDHLAGCDLCRLKLEAIRKDIGIIASIRSSENRVIGRRTGNLRRLLISTIRAAALLLIGLIIGYAAAKSIRKPEICVSGMYIGGQAPADSLAGFAVADAIAALPLP